MQAKKNNLFSFNFRYYLMKNFIVQLFKFSIIVLIIIAGGVFMPATPRASQSLLFSKISKDSLLKNSPSPRIILVGGSNLSFGIDSQLLKDSLKMNPINTGIHAMLGLMYMINSTKKYIRPGDVIIVSPEYDHYFGKYAYGGNELLRTVMDVSPNNITELSFRQWSNILRYLPEYSISKFKFKEYNFKIEKDNVYLRSSFNKYGDVFRHWNLKKEKFQPALIINGNFNPDVISQLINYEKLVKAKGAKLYVTYPCYQSSSFDNTNDKVKIVERELLKSHLLIIGTPQRYRFDDCLMYNTPYHLTKEGVEIRTRMLIDDIQKANNI